VEDGGAIPNILLSPVKDGHLLILLVILAEVGLEESENVPAKLLYGGLKENCWKNAILNENLSCLLPRGLGMLPLEKSIAENQKSFKI
jgi:hypothetical protein